MTATVDDLLAAFDDLVDRHTQYCACEGRCEPWTTGITDCSGMICGGYDHIGASLGLGCTGSFALAQHAHQLGLSISIEQARWTPGAHLFQGINEGQGGNPGVDPGHVGTSVGNGTHTVEARNSLLDVGYFYWNSLRWNYACLPFPTITTVAPTPPTTTPAPPKPIANAHLDEEMLMLSMPNTRHTPKGRMASARGIATMNGVLLEDGARVQGSKPVNNAADVHWWQPPKSVEVSGWQLAGIFKIGRSDCAQHGLAPSKYGYLVARYGYKQGGSGTYVTKILGP